MAVLVEIPRIGVRVARNIFLRQVFPIVAVAPKRLFNDCNTTIMRNGRWMGRRNWPHGENLTLIFPNSSMTLIPC